MEIEQIRLLALQELLSESGGKKAWLARRIGASASQVSQWFSGFRSISEESARSIERAFRKPPYWMDVHPRGPVMARAMSLSIRNMLPTLTWGDMKNAEQFPVEFEAELVDDSMAPRAPARTVVRFRAASTAAPGDGVLVKDMRGDIYFREYRARADGAWMAHAYNEAFPSLHNVDDGLKVIAVAIGVTIGWDLLPR